MLDVVQISEQWNEDEPKLNKLGAEVSSFLRKSIDTGLCRYRVPARGSETMGALPAM